MDLARVTAIHEAGHAVAAIRAGLVFDHVSAVPDDEQEIDGALYWHALHEQLELAMPPGLLAVVLLAGPCAEARLRKLRFDRVFSGEGAIDDRTAIAGMGLSDEEFVAASRDAMALIEQDWPIIERVAELLQARDTLSFEEVESIVAEQDSAAG
jgi:hypothetical protein